MKKIFTLALALMGFAGAANAASIDEIAPLKHSYVLVGDDYTNDGTEKIAKNALFGDDHFFTPTGHDKATNKGSIDLSSVDEVGIVTEEIAGKYGEYGNHLNSLRLKTNQDVFAISVTAKSKIIIFYENNKAKRYPIFAKDAKLENKLSSDADIKAEGVIGSKGYGRIEWTATDDGIVYVGAENQIFVSYVIIEANEAPGTPTVKVGPQTYEGGLWFREVTAKANDMVEEGSTEKIPTVLTYTTDGSAPTAASTVYTEPIKCYKDMIVKFQAFMDLGDGKPANDLIADGADNEGNVNFTFNSPSITADGANVTITSEYDGAKNYYKLNGANAIEGSTFTLTESATVEAYSQIVNGEYTTFTTKSTTKDVYVLNPIKEKKTITVTAADVVVDEEATASATDGSTVYIVENGTISADSKDFFVKDLEFAVIKDAAYQIDGQEAYIKMNSTNITFLVAAGETVKVKVVCSKNSCKNLHADDAEDGSQVNDRKCYVNVSGTNYCLKDADGNETNDLKLYPNANEFEFELAGGKNVTSKDDEGNEVTTFEAKDTYYTFLKYSGTGNILISSIEITPVESTSISAITNVEEKAKDAIFNLAGQQVDKTFKGVVIKNGKKLIQK
ncbi:MAG: chitobiase/beta-hexosaminidase C-terminal domain-containing protein [Prevotella sp.]|nr:chitobiase/beta-hexosaminidase C-terminal domain-containing protein [Prevotella sp.]